MPERKPPRQRAACGQCHGAKVKCSGEKTGCSRCARLGLACEYGISMVGRASKKKPNDDSSDVQMTDAAASSGLPPSLSSTDGFSFGSDATTPFDFSSLATQDLLSITGLNDLSFHAFPQSHTHSHNHMAPSPPGASSVPALSPDRQSPSAGHEGEQQGLRYPHPIGPLCQTGEPGHENCCLPGQQQGQPVFICDMTQDPQHTHTECCYAMPQQQQQQRHVNECVNGIPDMPEQPMSLSMDDAMRVSPAESMEPVFAFARLTFYLERALAKADKEPIDRTLGVIRSALRELMTMVKWEGTMPSYGCRALIFACLAMIVKLYRIAYARFRKGEEEERRERGGTGDMGASEDGPRGCARMEVSMRIGSYEVDPEDQARLQNQLISSELGRCIQVIKAMSMEQGKLCERGADCGGVRNYAMLEETANELRTEVEKESKHDKRMVHPLI